MKKTSLNKMMCNLQKFLDFACITFVVILCFVLIFFRDSLVNVLGFEFDIVRSNSMSGTIEKYDFLVVVGTDAKKIEDGDIVVFYDQTGNYKIIHRVIEKQESENGYLFVTKGDNANSCDIGFRTEDDIYALYAFKLPYVGLVITFFTSTLGLFVVLFNIWDFILILIIWELDKSEPNYGNNLLMIKKKN